MTDRHWGCLIAGFSLGATFMGGCVHSGLLNAASALWTGLALEAGATVVLWLMILFDYRRGDWKP